MCEQKFEQEQTRQTPGKKILWSARPENENQIGRDPSRILERAGGRSSRVVYQLPAVIRRGVDCPAKSRPLCPGGAPLQRTEIKNKKSEI